jgi:DNA-binding NarL/FixJ family response regulator
MQGVRALVVDDCERWRKIVRAALRRELGLHMVEEAADGLQAVEKAENLQPDLVVLDIGLPRLNGIEVARRIRSISPQSRVVFLTANDSCDLAEAACNSGAKAYVTKSEFVRELIPAIEAVLAGRHFLSVAATRFSDGAQTV